MPNAIHNQQHCISLLIVQSTPMALTKSDIIHIVQTQLDLPKNQCNEIVESLLEIIKADLSAGNDVMISSFGKFCVKEKGVRRGRNPDQTYCH